MLFFDITNAILDKLLSSGRASALDKQLARTWVEQVNDKSYICGYCKKHFKDCGGRVIMGMGGPMVKKPCDTVPDIMKLLKVKAIANDLTTGRLSNYIDDPYKRHSIELMKQYMTRDEDEEG